MKGGLREVVADRARRSSVGLAGGRAEYVGQRLGAGQGEKRSVGLLVCGEGVGGCPAMPVGVGSQLA